MSAAISAAVSADDLGIIVGIFVQREPLKRGRAPLRQYCTDDILAVPAIRVDRTGVIGETADNQIILDVHNMQHPASRDRKGTAGVSFMATGDYNWLRGRYGTHLTDGSAGCTLLLDNDAGLAGRAFPDGVTIHSTAGQLHLDAVQAAEPCVEFCRFCLGLPPAPTVGDDVRQALMDLDHGHRGYLGVATRPGLIRVGDRVSKAARPAASGDAE
jgi:hypothetical protein